jgi:hypothetical protein
VELERNKARLAELGLGVCSISYDSVEILRDFAARRGITIPMLADPESAIIKRFGLFNEQVQQGTHEYGIPHPATILADAAGIVRRKIIDEPYIHRMRVATLLHQLEDVLGETAAASYESQPQSVAASAGGRFTVDVAATEAVLYPGNVVTVSIDVRPAAGIVILKGDGPQDQGQNLVVEFEESPFHKARSLRYPPASPIWVPSLKTSALGYAEPFRIEADLALANRFDLQPVFDAGGRLEVRASLRLRACDRESCPPAQTVPLLWTFPLLPPDLERPPEPLRHEARLQRKG